MSEEHYTKQVQVMTYDEGFILHPEEAKNRLEAQGFVVVMIKNHNGKQIILARPEDITKIQKSFLGRYHLLNKDNAEY